MSNIEQLAVKAGLITVTESSTAFTNNNVIEALERFKALVTKQSARDSLIEVYLDFRNNYLTIEKYAEHNGLHYNQAVTLLALAKDVFNSKHPEE
jgi:hypothetical protein